MTRAESIRQQARELTNREKAELDADLLEGLPAILDDEDAGLAEAQRRDAELDADPSISITWEHLRQGLGR